MVPPHESSKNPKRARWVAPLLIGFGLLHSASLLGALLPSGWWINQVLDPYRRLTGTVQNWRMFDTIPVAQRVDVAVEVVDTDGGKVVLGPRLPGLAPVDLDSNIRFFPLLERMTVRDGVYWEGYLELLRKAVDEEFGAAAKEFSVIKDADVIRLLERIQEDGKATVRHVEAIGPFSVRE